MDGNGVFYDQYGAPIGKLAGDGSIYGNTETPPPGGGSDASFLYTQNTPTTSWHVVHNLGKYPAVSVLDSARNVVEGLVLHNSLNDCTITFAVAFAGSATLN